MPSILEVNQLEKKFGQNQAVKGISFNVEEGEIFGLLGPNGAGKTTAISMLTGVLEPTSGSARIGGHDLRTEPFAVKQLIGLVPQDLALYPTLSARANLNFFGSIYGLRGKELQERINEVLDIVALKDRQNEAIEKFSGGMKRRVNIAIGLVNRPRLLFLDEPTVGVDPQSRNHIFESVLKLNKEYGMSIIYTSHYMEEVELLCSRAAIIDQGKIIAMDTIHNLIDLLGGGVIQVGVDRADDDLVAELGRLPEVKGAARQVAPVLLAEGEAAPQPDGNAGVIKINAENSHKAVVNVISLLSERGVRITSLEILEPNLESVFLHLTGKKLRE